MNEESEKVLKSIGILSGDKSSVAHIYFEALEEQSKLKEQEEEKRKKEEKDQNG